MIEVAKARLGTTLLSTLLLLGACHEVPKGTSDAGVADGPAAPPASTAARRRPAPTTAAAAPQPTATTSSLELQGGGRLTLPPGAMKKENSASSRLPSLVGRSHVFRLGDDKHLLMVNELSLDGGTCASALDEELARMNAAKDDTDPRRLRFRRLGEVETLEVKGERVLYGESKNRGLAGADAGRPMVAMANLLMCRGPSYLLILYASDQPTLPAGTKQMLLDLAGSYRAD